MNFSKEVNTEKMNNLKQRKQKKLVDMEGIVTQNLSNGKFRLKLEASLRFYQYQPPLQ